jgi:hypothetical protein
MAFFRNILRGKRVGVDTDMEAGNNPSDVELADMEAGSGSAHYLQPDHYPNSLNPDSMSPGPTFPQTTLPFPQALLPPSQISSRALNINRKRSHSEDRTSKVRVVEQGSKISTIVRIYRHKTWKFNYMGFYRERLASDIR